MGVRRLTVVLERRPPSPSIQTSAGESVGSMLQAKRRHTLSLDLVALGESKERGEQVVVVNIGHGGWGRRNVRKRD
jgi:hypothetical protein